MGNKGSIFDNVLVTDSFDQAKKVAEDIKQILDKEKDAKKAWDKANGKDTDKDRTPRLEVPMMMMMTKPWTWTRRVSCEMTKLQSFLAAWRRGHECLGLDRRFAHKCAWRRRKRLTPQICL